MPTLSIATGRPRPRSVAAIFRKPIYGVDRGLPHPLNRGSGSAESVFRVTFPTTNDGSVSNRLHVTESTSAISGPCSAAGIGGTQEGEYDEAEIFTERPIVMIRKLEIET